MIINLITQINPHYLSTRVSGAIMYRQMCAGNDKYTIFLLSASNQTKIEKGGAGGWGW